MRRLLGARIRVPSASAEVIAHMALRQVARIVDDRRRREPLSPLGAATARSIP
jgi:hypothetical protein